MTPHTAPRSSPPGSTSGPPFRWYVHPSARADAIPTSSPPGRSSPRNVGRSTLISTASEGAGPRSWSTPSRATHLSEMALSSNLMGSQSPPSRSFTSLNSPTNSRARATPRLAISAGATMVVPLPFCRKAAYPTSTSTSPALATAASVEKNGRKASATLGLMARNGTRTARGQRFRPLGGLSFETRGTGPAPPAWILLPLHPDRLFIVETEVSCHCDPEVASVYGAKAKTPSASGWPEPHARPRPRRPCRRRSRGRCRSGPRPGR